MLRELVIRNLAVWPQATFRPGPGLTVITGESGAGKSLILEAIRLALGDRPMAPLVRHGEAQAQLVSRWEVADPFPEGLTDLDPEEDLVVTRVIGADGRSSCRLGDVPVPLSRLRRLAGALVRGGRQGEAALLKGEEVLDLLDAAAGLEAERRRVEAAYRAAEEAKTEWRQVLGGDPAERARRLDYLAWAIREIEEVAPQPGERARLQQEWARLRHAESLRRQVGQALAALTGDGEGSGARDGLGEAYRALREAAALDAGLETAAERLLAAREEVEDLARELGRYLDGVEADPARQAEVAQRLATLADLSRKYGEGEEAILAEAERLRQERQSLLEGAGREAELRERAQAAEAAWREAALALSQARQVRAEALSQAIAERLRRLALPQVRVQVVVAPRPDAPPAARGLDEVRLQFQANPGEPLRPLAEIASGGETSRVLLAVEAVMAEGAPGVTWLFDEVEAGVGGAAAWAVAEALASLARGRQVIAVTHLAPVAAVADAHWRAVKEPAGRGRVAARLEPVEGDERLAEMARLLSGRTAAATAHARDLLAEGERLRRKAQGGEAAGRG